MRSLAFLVLAAFPLLPMTAGAGLHYSGEVMAELPSQWRGFLLDQRMLRSIAVAPAAGAPAGPARIRYQAEAARLEKTRQTSKLSADDLADLGAIYVRLGEAGKAVVLLRGQRAHPNHFRIVANLGTAWQLHGDLEQAALTLQQAVRLAPGKFQRAEEYHLKLVRQRLRQGKNGQELDDLFGIRYIGDKETYEPGKLAPAERKKLPAHAMADAQQLALWLPADARLLWQLAELANAFGDVRTGAAMMDGCVTQFNLQPPELRRHRQILRTAADRLVKDSPDAKTAHEIHDGLATRSKRPLVTRLDQEPLPPISATGVNSLPWPVLSETTVDAKFRPTFGKYLQELDGKQVTLNGYMQPLRDDPEIAAFMFIEYPVGCWYCEMPETAGIVYVELPVGRATPYVRGLIRVTGRLILNANDPEDFLYALRDARVGGVD